jgi:dihydroorotate dehydrogenase electron transfer subunit
MASNHDAPLVGRQSLGDAYFLLTFRHPEVACEARAGQFVMIKASTASEPLLRRPFSIMNVDPGAETFTLLLKAVGAGSRSLADLWPGETAGCLGPLGRPFTAPPDALESLLVAGGYGIAPFLLFGDELAREGLRSRVFYGGRTVRDLQIREAFEERGIPLVAATEDGSLGFHGRVTEALSAYLDEGATHVGVYACGPTAMLEATSRVATARGLPVQVSLDPWMGCGVGTCLGCVVRIQQAEETRPKFRCACTEGPVFDGRDVVWESEETSFARLTRERAVRA